MRLKDKICIVTGAAQGFGAAIARRFAAEGAKVLVADVNGEGAAKLAAMIGTNAEPFTADVSNGSDFSAMAARCVAAFGGLDIVVNNAGTTYRNQPMLNVTEAMYDRLMAINVKSIFHSAHACVPILRRQGRGCMLNIASTGGIRPRPGLTWYNASKGAVIAMTKAMAIELAPDRIRVNALCPVAAETALLRDFMGEDTPEMRAKFVSTIPLGRFCTPEDVAKAALHLCSDEADFLTGVCLEVDGGRTI